MRKKKHGVNGTQKKLIVFIFTIIPISLLLLFSYFPLIKMFQYSVTDWDGLRPVSNFVGVENYKTVFTDSEYFTVFRTSLYYFVATFIQLGIALLFATILSFEVKFANFWKGALFFPYLLNGVAIGFIFLYFFKPDGTLDTVLTFIGLEDQIRFWLGDRSLNNISLAFTSIWRFMGFNFLILLGAIQSINPEVYEASEIDGANKWQQFRFIIVPSIKEIIYLNLVLGISGAISVFEVPYVMTGGSNGTETFVIKTINTAFQFNKVGLASAMALILLAIVLVVTLIQRLITSEKVKRK